MSVEMWRNTGLGLVVVSAWDDLGVQREQVIRGREVAPIRTKDRERMATLGWDGPFRDGLLSRVDDGEGPKGGAITDEEIAAILKTRSIDAMVAKLDKLTEVNARKVAEVAAQDEDLSGAKQKAVAEHITEKYLRQEVMPSYEEMK